MKLSAVRAGVRRIAESIMDAIDLRDLFVFAGLAALGYGLWQVYAPAAWIVVGAVVFLLGIRR